MDEVTDVVALLAQHCRTRVESADLQQVVEQRLEPVQLRLQQLRRTLHHRIEVLPGLVQHVCGHPYRRQRRAELVRDIGDELLLHPRQLLQLPDLVLQARRHLVEAGRQPGQVIPATHDHPLREVARGEPFGDPRRQSHRRDHLAGDQPGQGAQQQDQQQPRGHQGRAHQVDGGLLLRQGEQVIELVLVTGRCRDLSSHGKCRYPVSARVAVRNGGIGVEDPFFATHMLTQRLGDDSRHPVEGDPRRCQAYRVVLGAEHDDLVERVRPGLVTAVGQALGDVRQQRTPRARRAVRGGIEITLGIVDPGRGVGDGRIGLGLQQPVADLSHQSGSEQDHHDQ